eukprot:2317648-Pyramimonas_sp.AAC.1
MSEGAGGGRRASAMAATTHRLALPTDKSASGRTQGDATCRFVKQEKICPEAGQGCRYNHQNQTRRPSRGRVVIRGQPAERGTAEVGMRDRGARGQKARTDFAPRPHQTGLATRMRRSRGRG